MNAVSTPARTGNVPQDGAVPPAPLFGASQNLDAEMQAALQEAREEAARVNRNRKWTGKVGWVAAAVGWTVAGALAVGIAALFPLRRDVHHYTVLNSADNTAAVFRSTWDLPASKREELILATAANYVRACERYDYYQLRADYLYCAGLSIGGRLAEYDALMKADNPAGPQAVLGTRGTRIIRTETPVRYAANAIRVPFSAVTAKPGEAPVQHSRYVILDYVDVQQLPTSLKLQHPSADILFFRAVPEEAPAPIPTPR
jgi:type IV secretory pathway component VirB8